MKNFVSFFFLAFFTTVPPGNDAALSRMVGYYGSWAVYSPTNGKFDVEQIDPTLYTHLIYSFIGINPDGTIKVLDPWNDLPDNGGKAAMKRFVGLKSKNPKLKVLVAIGGWNAGSATFSNVMKDTAKRAYFVQNAVNFVKKHNFDGFDVDWEYPNSNGGVKADVKNFVSLLQELRTQFNQYGLILSAAVGASSSSIQTSYDVPNLSKYLDFINVMTYDLHGSWETVTGQNSPLYASSKDVTDFQKQMNVKACIDAWIQKGADPSKLNLGIGAYGRSFTLANPGNNGVGAPTTGPGTAGPYTGQEGLLGYNEITEYLKKPGWTVVWDDQQKVPYMYKGNQWVGYDNPKSVGLKVDMAKKSKLGGLMVWSIDTDDFQGVSGTKNPIQVAMKSGLAAN